MMVLKDEGNPLGWRDETHKAQVFFIILDGTVGILL
jgi:hypothetical protein